MARPRRRRKRKPRGFSDSPWRGIYDPFTEFLGVDGPEKRTMLNTFSIWIAFAAAVSSGFGGCFFAIEEGGVGIVPGWAIGLFTGAIVFNVVMGWLEKDRYYRS